MFGLRNLPAETNRGGGAQVTLRLKKNPKRVKNSMILFQKKLHLI